MLYILCGLPFSGKTTLANALIKKFGFSLVSIDKINKEKTIGENEEPITSEDWDDTYHESFTKLDGLLNEDKSVVYDATNFIKEQRDTLKEIAQENGKETKIIYVTTPKEDCFNRWQENKKHNIRKEDFIQVINDFEEPTEDENVMYYDNSMDFEKWIKENIIMSPR